MTQEMTFQIFLGITSLLLTVNGFFLRRMISKVEGIPLLNNRMETMETELKDIRREIHELARLRERIAVLEFALREAQNGRNENRSQ